MRRGLIGMAGAAGMATAASAQPVIVQVDMDPSRPGMQAVVDVPPGTATVPVAVYIYDPLGTRAIESIGFIGGLDRGISFGHIPRAGNQGQVTSLTGHAGTLINPSGTALVFPAQQPGFAGPEVQYVEVAGGPAVPLPSSPVNPVFTVDINLSGAAAGDVFPFALMDLVTVWRGGQGGAFTTGPGHILDTGGDVTPDGTQGLEMADPDVPQPVPPAAFPVDYVDGGRRPALVRIGGCYANCDGSTSPPVLNVNDFICFQGEFVAGNLYANCDGSTESPVLNINDYICFQTRFAAGCP